MTADVVRFAVELAVALGGGATLATLLTIRQKRALIAAQADDVKATGQARIIDASARIVEQSADLVPQLVERIAKLEAAGERRQLEVDTLRDELDEVHRWADAAVRWMANAVRLIAELGGQIAPPPDAPQVRSFPRPQPPGVQ